MVLFVQVKNNSSVVVVVVHIDTHIYMHAWKFCKRKKEKEKKTHKRK
jgi:hypothetical protein